MEHKLIKTIFFASFVWIAGVILMPDALGADTVVYAIQGGNDVLGTLDLNTGIFTQISTQAVNDYELGVYGGVLYGANTQFGGLFQLNTSTGAVTLAPTYFQQNASGFGVLNGFGSTTDGLFAMAGAIPGGVNYLWSVNPATGVPTQVGSTGVVAGGGSGFLSASNDSSKLYWEVQNGYTDTLYSINTSTGAATLMGVYTFNGYSTTGDAFSMVFTGGTLWANFYGGGFGTISTSTGVQTLVSTAPAGSSNAFFGIAPYPLGPANSGGSYYLSDLAFAGGFQTTLTLINYSPQAVTCTTNFYSDSGGPLLVPFAQGAISARTDVLPPGGSIHDQTIASLTAAVTEGWARSTCTGPVEASLLYRFFTNGVATSEAGVNAEAAPTTSFVTFAQTATGIAYANPSTTQSATVTFTVFNNAGANLGSKSITLGPLAHGASNLGPLLGLTSFTGMVEITSTIPINSLSLNAEAFPVISSLPPGDLPSGFGGGGGATTYYFSDLAFAGGFQTTLTLINYSPQAVTCTTKFYSDSGAPLSIAFSQGAISTRTDVLPPNGSIHDQTIASLTAAVTEGWAQSSCTGPVQASLLYRLYTNGVATSEAGVNAETAPTTEFATFAQTATGVAYANPSTTQSASIAFEVYSAAGTRLGSQTVTLGPLAHSAANLGPLLGLTSFTGFVKITSTIPIVSLSLNAEAFPVISSLPPGDLSGSTALVP